MKFFDLLDLETNSNRSECSAYIKDSLACPPDHKHRQFQCHLFKNVLNKCSIYFFSLRNEENFLFLSLSLRPVDVVAALKTILITVFIATGFTIDKPRIDGAHNVIFDCMCWYNYMVRWLFSSEFCLRKKEAHIERNKIKIFSVRPHIQQRQDDGYRNSFEVQGKKKIVSTVSVKRNDRIMRCWCEWKIWN